MSQKLKLVKGAARKVTLVYGMRVFDGEEIEAVEDAQVQLQNGSRARITMHVIDGSPVQVRNQLLRSVDAFFDLLAEE